MTSDELQRELDAAKSHISELQETLDATQEGLDSANQRIGKLEGALQSAISSAKRRKERAEAAERKLAAAIDALHDVRKHQQIILPKQHQFSPVWKIVTEALAQIEQPQEKSRQVGAAEGLLLLGEIEKLEHKLKLVIDYFKGHIEKNLMINVPTLRHLLAQIEQPQDEYANASTTKQPPGLMNSVLSARTDEQPPHEHEWECLAPEGGTYYWRCKGCTETRPYPNNQIEQPQSTPAEREEPEDLARQFHESYERLAPDFGYETRKESARPWEQVPPQNKQLMIAVAAEIIAAGWRKGAK